MGKYKKKLKSEKSKTHIKSKTKFLPKGQNVTKTEFKIKPIVINKQLKETIKQTNIADLVKKFNHYNDKIKIEALENLCKILQQNGENSQIHAHLSSIIQNCSYLIQDKDRKVRRNCVKLINELLIHIAPAKVATFFNFLATNLKCGMTNIDKNIQEDSLLFLDCILNRAPILIANNSNNILPAFLTLISKFKNETKSERTLTMNLDSKLTSVCWRIKVLSRLYGILEALLQKNSKTESCDGENNRTVRISDGSNFFPIFGSSVFQKNYYIDFFGKTSGEIDDFSKNLLNKQIITLIPVLYETWLEIIPEKSQNKSKNEKVILNEESAAIFGCIVNILYLLHEYFPQNSAEVDIFHKEISQFLENLLSNFPYSQNDKKLDSKNSNVPISLIHNDQNCVKENLMLSHLFCLTVNSNEKICSKFNLVLIVKYLNSLIGENYLNATNMKYLILISEEIFINKLDLFRKNGVNLDETLINIIKLYENSNLEEEQKNQLINLIELINTASPIRCAEFRNWLKKLPLLLCNREISDEIINILLVLSKKNNRMFQNSLKKNLQKILNNLLQLKIVHSPNVDVSRMKIVYLFIYLDSLEAENIDCIENFVNCNKNSVCSKHFKDMLTSCKSLK